MKNSENTVVSALLFSPKEYFEEKIEEGLSKKNLKTYPAVQSYLVHLLEYYLDARNLFETNSETAQKSQPTTLAETFLIANSSEPHVRVEMLKKLGDKSLYISGFFGESLSRKVVDIEYYAGMGGAAYRSLADVVREDTLSLVYRVMSNQFLDFVEVLTYISQQSMITSDESILRLYDRYLRTGSQLARDKLIEMGVVTVSKDNIKLVRQD